MCQAILAPPDPIPDSREEPGGQHLATLCLKVWPTRRSRRIGKITHFVVFRGPSPPRAVDQRRPAPSESGNDGPHTNEW